MQVHTMMNGESVHRHQLVTREYKGSREELVVVGIEDDTIYVQDPAFEYPRMEVDEERWEEEDFRGKTAAHGTPQFAY